MDFNTGDYNGATLSEVLPGGENSAGATTGTTGDYTGMTFSVWDASSGGNKILWPFHRGISYKATNSSPGLATYDPEYATFDDYTRNNRAAVSTLFSPALHISGVGNNFNDTGSLKLGFAGYPSGSGSGGVVTIELELGPLAMFVPVTAYLQVDVAAWSGSGNSLPGFIQHFYYQ
jgi:hypothetical protein